VKNIEYSNRQIGVAAVLAIVTCIEFFLTRLYVIYGPGESHRPFPTDSLVLIWSIPSLWLMATLAAVYSAIALRRGAPPSVKLRFLSMWVLAVGFLGFLLLRLVILGARP
jgi:hypothetical protein